MGVYSLDRHNLSNTVVAEADTSYDYVTGAQRMMLESEMNDMAIFEAVIKSDMEQTYKLNEGVLLEAELKALTEGNVKSFFSRIYELLKKFVEKIRGIFATFINKLKSIVEKDNVTLVKKYANELRKKDLSQFKYTKLDVGTDIALDPEEILMLNTSEVEKVGTSRVSPDSELNKDFDNEEYLVKLLKKATKYDFETSSDFHSAVKTKYLEDCTEKDHLMTSGDLEEIIMLMTTSKKMIDMAQAQEKLILSTIEAEKIAYKNIEKDYSQKNDADVQKALNRMYTMSTIAQKAVTMSISLAIDIIKTVVGSGRATFMTAVKYSPKTESEDLSYEHDIAFAETMSLFESEF